MCLTDKELRKHKNFWLIEKHFFTRFFFRWQILEFTKKKTKPSLFFRVSIDRQSRREREIKKVFFFIHVNTMVEDRQFFDWFPLCSSHTSALAGCCHMSIQNGDYFETFFFQHATNVFVFVKESRKNLNYFSYFSCSSSSTSSSHHYCSVRATLQIILLFRMK